MRRCGTLGGREKRVNERVYCTVGCGRPPARLHAACARDAARGARELFEGVSSGLERAARLSCRSSWQTARVFSMLGLRDLSSFVVVSRSCLSRLPAAITACSLRLKHGGYDTANRMCSGNPLYFPLLSLTLLTQILGTGAATLPPGSMSRGSTVPWF